MTSSQPPAPHSPSPEEQARMEAGKRAVNIMLLGMGLGVIAVIVYGLYQMTSVILDNL